MDSRVSVRFFTVVPSVAGQGSFESYLKKLIALSPNASRKLDDDVTIQAANIQESGDRISGDLVRVQDENLPSLIPNAGKHPEKLVLTTGAGLGHHTAFLYDKSIKVLAYQITRNAVPLGRFNGYIVVACELKQLNRLQLKTLLIKVADPDSLDAIEDNQRKLKNSLKNLRSLADGVYIKVQIGLANNKGHLDKGAVGNLVGWLMEHRLTGKGKVSAVQVSGKDLQSGDVDLDFIKEQIGESKTLQLSDKDPDENYKNSGAICFRLYGQALQHSEEVQAKRERLRLEMTTDSKAHSRFLEDGNGFAAIGVPVLAALSLVFYSKVSGYVANLGIKIEDVYAYVFNLFAIEFGALVGLFGLLACKPTPFLERIKNTQTFASIMMTTKITMGIATFAIASTFVLGLLRIEPEHTLTLHSVIFLLWVAVAAAATCFYARTVRLIFSALA
jgi:hypothetical protein